MSDDPDHLFPVTGWVRREDARRLAKGRTLVHLDTVDFAPILAALKPLAETARLCAGLITGDGRTGSAGLRLLSQTAERWRAFESAVVRAGLTESAPLMIYGNGLPMVEQRRAVVYELWDLLSHRRRGRFDGAKGLDRLAKQADATAALVQALTPRATPPAESTRTAPTDPKPGYLNLLVYKESGTVRRVGKVDRFGRPKEARFETDSAEWHTFLVAYQAGERGATDEEWRQGYPGAWSGARRKRKAAVKEKLFALDVELAEGRGLRLVDLPPHPSQKTI